MGDKVYSTQTGGVLITGLPRLMILNRIVLFLSWYSRPINQMCEESWIIIVFLSMHYLR